LAFIAIEEKFAISFISDVIPNQNTRVSLFNFKKEVHQAPEKDVRDDKEVCTNCRYVMRHDLALAKKNTKKEEE